MATIDDSSTQGDGNVRLPVVGPENKVLVVPTEPFPAQRPGRHESIAHLLPSRALAGSGARRTRCAR